MSFLINLIFILFVLFIIKMILIAVFFHDEIKEARKKDPAAKNFLEVLILYHGLHALVNFRIAHFFYKRRLFFLARLISQAAYASRPRNRSMMRRTWRNLASEYCASSEPVSVPSVQARSSD